MNFLGIACESKIQKEKKYVCSSRVMEISLTGNSMEFKSSMHLVCKYFSRTYCRWGILPVITFTIGNRATSQLVKFASLQESTENRGKEGNGGVTGEMNG